MEDILKKRLLDVLKKAGLEAKDDDTLITQYENALAVSEKGYKILHKRDIDEIFINNYNSEWILNWNANMDIQLCPDFYAVLTYISDYFSKDDSGTM